MVPIAVLAGLLTPPLTPALRSILPRLVGDELRLTAFALESTIQEVVFVAGPLVAAVTAWLAGPRAALVVAALATVVGVVGYVLAVGRAGLPAAETQATDGARREVRGLRPTVRDSRRPR